MFSCRGVARDSLRGVPNPSYLVWLVQVHLIQCSSHDSGGEGSWGSPFTTPCFHTWTKHYSSVHGDAWKVSLLTSRTTVFKLGRKLRVCFDKKHANTEYADFFVLDTEHVLQDCLQDLLYSLTIKSVQFSIACITDLFSMMNFKMMPIAQRLRNDYIIFLCWATWQGHCWQSCC